MFCFVCTLASEYHQSQMDLTTLYLEYTSDECIGYNGLYWVMNYKDCASKGIRIVFCDNITLQNITKKEINVMISLVFR